jgi:energy-coupling factor transporter ATP-binding protein EcfA2
VRDWAARSFDDSFEAVRELEIECARGHDLVVARGSGDPAQVLAVLERDYRRRVVKEYGFVDIRGIQISHRVTLDLDKVYVPLHLEETIRAFMVSTDWHGILGQRRTPATEAFQQHRRLLIVGTPGSGKTTLISFLATGLADGKLGSQENLLPLVLVVRALKEAPLTPAWLAGHLALEERLVAQALAQGRAVLLVDGLDEAPGGLRKELVTSLGAFSSDYPDVRVVVTTRPAGAPGAIERSLPALTPFRLADLTPEEVEDFVDKWCLAAETSVRKDLTEARKEATAAAKDLNERISRNRPVQRIAVNPLLTTILCVVHRFLGRSIPEHRVTLYDKCTDALLYEWDRAKFPAGAAIGELDANQKRTLLRGVARALHEKHQAEIPEEEVVRHFAKLLPDLGKPVSAAKRIVHEIRDRSGLLIERRPGHFAFSHLTFQEYLTALDCVYTREFKQLIDKWKDPWWHEVILLAAGVPGSDPGAIARGLLAKKDDLANLLAAQSLETAVDMPLSVRRRIEKALEGLIPPRDFRSAERLGKVGDIAAPLLLKHLPNSDRDAKAWILNALFDIDYDPAIPAIAQCASDAEDTFAGASADSAYPSSNAELATFVLATKAAKSETARRAFAAALKRPHRARFLNFLRHELAFESPARQPRLRDLQELIDAALTRARRGKGAPTPAKSTG